jgi:hypothetical protein
VAPDANLVFLPGLSRLNDHSLYQRTEIADQCEVGCRVLGRQYASQILKVLFEALNGLWVKFNYVRMRFGVG